MKVADLERHFDNQATAARYLRLSRACISVWKKRGIPIAQQYRIERLTNGKLQAERP